MARLPLAKILNELETRPGQWATIAIVPSRRRAETLRQDIHRKQRHCSVNIRALTITDAVETSLAVLARARA